MTPTKEQVAERWLYQRLDKILGRDRRHVAAYGLRFDPSINQQYIGVDFAPETPPSVLARVPKSVGNIDVRVRRISLNFESAVLV